MIKYYLRTKIKYCIGSFFTRVIHKQCFIFTEGTFLIVSRFEKHSKVLNKNFLTKLKLQFLCEFYMIVLFDNFVIATCCSHGWLHLLVW